MLIWGFVHIYNEMGLLTEIEFLTSDMDVASWSVAQGSIIKPTEDFCYLA